MKKYGLVALLSLSFISHATAQNTSEADDYYKKALENTQQLNVAKSKTAETIYQSAEENMKKIEEISQKLQDTQSKTSSTPEEPQAVQQKQAAQQALQIELLLLQARLQADSVKLQSLALIQAKDTKTTEERLEEKAQQKHEELIKTLKEKIEGSDVRL
ncbi:type IV secretion system protein VirB5 [Bartonella jaculi]|uniref:VirB5 n=1 Tax=Bartonella jaculi TaxID=686226 RepID=A0ABP9N311_9HYPH